MVAPNQESVEYNILIEAKAAVVALSSIVSKLGSFDAKVRAVTAAVEHMAKKWGMSFNAAKGLFRDLDRELSATGESVTMFGELNRQGWESVSNSAKKGSKSFIQSLDVMRIAAGTIVAQIIFFLTSSLGGALREMVANLRETELAVYNLINAERKLSEAGVDITPKGLQEMVDSVREILPILSQVDAEELIGRIAANVAPSLKLSAEYMQKLAETTALAYVQNKALGYSFDELEKSLTDSVLTGKVSQGLNKYGIKIDDLIVKQHAVKMGLVESEQAFEDLDAEAQAHVQAMALIDYAHQEFSKNLESIPEYLKTTDAAFEKLNTTWSDFLTQAAQLAGPLIIKSLEILINGLELVMSVLEKITPPLQRLIATIAGFAAAVKGKGFYFFTDPTFFDTWMNKTEEVMESFKGLAEAADTPTAAIDELQEAVDDFDAEGFGNEIEKILEDAKRAKEDLDIKFEQKKDDLDTEYDRKVADAELELAREIEDINRDAERDLANIKEKHREEDLKAEQDYQNKLWELRMRYLMDLEEALHARDARQVLRLMKQYAIDKEALERKKNLEDQEREQSQANEIEDIERRRQERIEDAKIEHQQKLDDLNKAKARELEDLNVWYAREQADLDLATQRKLESLVKAWIDEKKITENGAAEVYKVLYSYFGPGGLTDALYAYMQQQLVAQAQQALAMAQAMGSYAPTMSAPASTPSLDNVSGDSGGSSSSGGSSGGRPGGRRPNQRTNRYAEGGTLIATRPTRALFGEAGPEAVTFTPLNRIGKNEGRVFGSGDGMGVNGMIEVAVNLSPDLEARIVDASMDGVADIIAKVNRSKV